MLIKYFFLPCEYIFGISDSTMESVVTAGVVCATSKTATQMKLWNVFIKCHNDDIVTISFKDRELKKYVWYNYNVTASDLKGTTLHFDSDMTMREENGARSPLPKKMCFSSKPVKQNTENTPIEKTVDLESKKVLDFATHQSSKADNVLKDQSAQTELSLEIGPKEYEAMLKDKLELAQAVHLSL